MVISMLKIRRPLGRLIFNMGIAIPGKTVFLIETAPWILIWRTKPLGPYIGKFFVFDHVVENNYNDIYKFFLTIFYYFDRNTIDSWCFIILKTVNGELNFFFSEDVIDDL